MFISFLEPITDEPKSEKEFHPPPVYNTLEPPPDDNEDDYDDNIESRSSEAWKHPTWLPLKSINTVEAPVSGHPREAEKVSPTGAGRLQEYVNTAFVWASRVSRRPWVEMSAYESVRSASTVALL